MRGRLGSSSPLGSRSLRRMMSKGSIGPTKGQQYELETALASAEQQLTNIGVVAALLLTISFSLYFAVDKSEWERNDFYACCCTAQYEGTFEAFKRFVVDILDEQPGFNYTVHLGGGNVVDTRQDWLDPTVTGTVNNWCSARGAMDKCGTPPFIMFRDAFPLTRFRMWQATAAGKAVCPIEGLFNFHPENDLSQNGFIRYNLYATVTDCFVLALSILGLLSQYLGGVRLAASRGDHQPYERWHAVILPMLILMVLLTVAGAFFMFVAVNRITLALSNGVDGSFSQSYHFCISVLFPLFVLAILLAALITARSRGSQDKKVSPEPNDEAWPEPKGSE